MKAFWRSKSRRERRGAPRVSLFPFLAVLICTMGALILLLLFVSRQARLQAAREASAKTAQQQSSIAAEMEMVQWRVDQLKASRQETEAQLGEARTVLGHIEEHSRRLRQQFQELSVEAKKAADEGLKPGRMVAAGEAELRQIEGQIAEAQQRLAQAERSAGKRPKSYAIVPYDGPNRTRRRPIYIECRGDAVVLQPENIRFTETDFDEPLGPGNPLAAAVRAAREQMLLQGSANPQNTGEPYPLLLVRPSGIPAYDAALAAMKSWGSEFGYELINEEWQLKFPPPDPSLARAVNEAIALARQEHARLIAAAPSKYGKRPRNGSFRSPTGDDADLAGGAGEGESPGFYSSRPSDRYASQSGGGPTVVGRSGHGSGGTGPGGNGPGGNGNGGDSSSVPAGDIEFREHNPYASLDAPGGGGGPVGMLAGGGGNGTGYGPGGGSGGGPGGGAGVPGYGPAGAPPGTSPAGMGPAVTGNGTSYGAGNGPGGPAGSNFAGGAAGPAGMGPFAPGNGANLGSGGGAGGPAGSGFGGGMPGSAGTVPGGSGGVAGTAGTGGSGGNGSSYGPGNGSGGSPGAAIAGGMAGSSAMGSGAGNMASAGGPSGTPSDSQAGGSSAGVAIVRPDGYINGRPSDGAPPPQQPAPPSGVAMGPASPLLPGEYRPSDPPPKPDPDAEAKEKKKHPYDKVKLDHDRDDWALRNSTRHAAAISRPIHVDCYPDRIVLVPEEAGGEPRVILCEQGGRRDADKLVAAVWEIMDTWGMAGREMYWRPILRFYVAAGAEPRMLDMTRSLEGSGLVIERKQ